MLDEKQSQFNRADFLGLVKLEAGGVLADLLLQKFSGLTQEIEIASMHLATEQSLRVGILNSANAVLPEWPDNEWKNYPNIFKSPISIMEEALEVSKKLKVKPRMVKHGDKTTTSMALTNYLKIANRFSLSDIWGGLGASAMNQNIQDISSSYDDFDIPIILELSDMKKKASEKIGMQERWECYISQMEHHLNVFQLAVDSRKGLPLSMGTLCGYFIAVNNGDIMKGLYASTEFCEFLARGQSDIDIKFPDGRLRYKKIDSRWEIRIENAEQANFNKDVGVQDTPIYYEGTFALSSIVLDQTSLAIPVTYIKDVSHDPENALQEEDRMFALAVEKMNALESENPNIFLPNLLPLSIFKNTSFKNRAGAFYHFFSIISLLNSASPEIVAAAILDYSQIPAQLISNIQNLPNILINQQHGSIKMLSDLVTTTYLKEIDELFSLYV